MDQLGVGKLHHLHHPGVFAAWIRADARLLVKPIRSSGGRRWGRENLLVPLLHPLLSSPISIPYTPLDDTP